MKFSVLLTPVIFFFFSDILFTNSIRFNSFFLISARLWFFLLYLPSVVAKVFSIRKVGWIFAFFFSLKGNHSALLNVLIPEKSCLMYCVHFYSWWECISNIKLFYHSQNWNSMFSCRFILTYFWLHTSNRNILANGQVSLFFKTSIFSKQLNTYWLFINNYKFKMWNAYLKRSPVY